MVWGKKRKKVRRGEEGILSRLVFILFEKERKESHPQFLWWSSNLWTKV